MIQFILLETLKLLTFMICAVLIGIVIPMLVTLLLVYTTDLTFRECIVSVPFGWTTIIQTMEAFKYLNKMVEKYNTMILQEQLKKEQQQQKQDKKEE
jgi:hypothetical protein